MRTLAAVPAMVIMMAVGLAISEGCATTSPFMASGEIVRETGLQFLMTSQLMDKALDEGRIDGSTYREWRTFGRHFQAVYPLVVQMWTSAMEANDSAMEGKTIAVITELASELASFSQLGKMVFPAAPNLHMAAPDGGEL